MVFPGHFSTGCSRCRQRKVKCDETKPSCRRCYIYGKPCPGYTDQFHFRYTRKKDFERVSASSPAQRRDSEVSILSEVSVQTEFSVQSESSVQSETSTQSEANSELAIELFQAPIIPPPTTSYDDVSLCYFVRRFVSPGGPDGFPGHLTFLPILYDSQNPGLLEMATLSVAQMAAYNQFGDNKFGVEAYKSYGRAIGMMKDLINSEIDFTDDKIIATVLLFCTFKEISGEGHGDPNEHAPGLFYLLEKRGPCQIGTRIGAELFFLSLLRLQIFSFLHDDTTYTDPGAIATVLGLFDPLLRALSMMSKTLALRQALSKHMSLETYNATTESHDTEEGASIIEQCVEMLNEFYVWDTEAAAYWQSTFEGRAVPTALGEVSSGTTYYDAETACTIILVRSARLILLISILLYNGTMELIGTEIPGNSDAWIEFIPFLKSDVGKTIDDILASVPYALGDVDPNGQPTSMQHDGASAIVIVNSIKLVMYCAYITPEQLQKAKDILLRLHTVIGIKSAIGWAENEPVPKWAEEQNLLRSLDCTVAL